MAIISWILDKSCTPLVRVQDKKTKYPLKWHATSEHDGRSAKRGACCPRPRLGLLGSATSDRGGIQRDLECAAHTSCDVDIQTPEMRHAGKWKGAVPYAEWGITRLTMWSRSTRDIQSSNSNRPFPNLLVRVSTCLYPVGFQLWRIITKMYRFTTTRVRQHSLRLWTP
jgi:hypothetical protein